MLGFAVLCVTAISCSVEQEYGLLSVGDYATHDDCVLVSLIAGRCQRFGKIACVHLQGCKIVTGKGKYLLGLDERKAKNLFMVYIYKIIECPDCLHKVSDGE